MDAASSFHWHAGCIPVFIGPPYNSMPFAGTIDYRSAGMFFNVTNTTGWLSRPAAWSLSESSHATNPNDGVFWMPDIDVSGVIIQVGHILELAIN